MTRGRTLGLLTAAAGCSLALQACSTDCPNCPGAPAQLIISPSSPSVLPNDVVQLHAEVLDAAGHLLAGNPVVWSTLDPGVASIDTAGVATAGGVPGGARLMATRGGLADTVTLSVVTTSTFSQQVFPILATTCALGGCHVTPGPAPILNGSVSATYTILLAAASGYVTAGDTTVGKLLQRLRGDTTAVMPPQQQLNQLAPGNYHLITAWIAQGAQNN
jgi:hypothetical protein